MPTLLRVALAGASLISFASAQATMPLPVSASPPDGTSGYINPSFAGFGIEPSNLFSFAGQEQPNQLSLNLLQNLVNYTGSPPHIRLGGNTQDYMYYSENFNQWTYINNPNSKGQGVYASDSMLIGPRFYQAANRFPKGTPITYGLNLAYEESDYVDQITTMASNAITGLDNLNVVSFEIGNEPDLYLGNQFRTAPWSGRAYTAQWLDRAYHVYNKVLKSAGIQPNFFEAAQTASTIGTDFQIQDLVTFDITEQANGSSRSYLASWNQHDYYYYIGVSTYPLTLYHFMTLSTTKDQFAAWVSQIQQAEATPYPYALREMGVVGPIGMAGITDTFAAALWTLNFLLYTATLNMTSVQMHMTDNSNASAWQPIYAYGRQPFVRPNYYGFAAFDQIIGPSCQAQIYNNENIDFPPAYGGRLEVYSVYQQDTLSSVVIINSEMANATNTTKGTLTVQLSLPTQFAGQNLYLAYLTNEGADSQSGTTWNGISFEQSGDGTPTQVNSAVQSVTIGSDGSASVTVRDSEAVVCQVGTPVGQIQANASACAKVAASSDGTRSASGSSASSNAARSITRGGSQASITSVLQFSGTVALTIASSLCTGAYLLFA